MECVQCGAEFRRGGAAQGKRCEPCVVANRTGTCVECGALIVRVPGQPGQLPKRCDPCWVSNRQKRAEEARLRAMADPERAPLYRERNRKQVAQWRADNPDRARERDRATQKRRWERPASRMRILELRYGLEPGGYMRIFDAQGGACAICKVSFTEEAVPTVDHNHGCCGTRKACGACVRGLLCKSCNTGLGWFKDNPTALRAAADYLERPQSSD